MIGFSVSDGVEDYPAQDESAYDERQVEFNLIWSVSNNYITLASKIVDG
jgi:hypothetical protein